MGHNVENLHFWLFGGIGEVGGGGGGGGEKGFNNQTGPILVHIYSLIYINLHVKYGSNVIRILWVLNPEYKKLLILIFGLHVWAKLFGGPWVVFQ